MKRTNELQTQEMTEKEIKQALKDFKTCLKMGLFTYTHADPMQQNCYTSSSDIIGVFFPNSQIKSQVKTIYSRLYYDFVALVKVGGVLGFVVSFNEEKAPDFIKKYELHNYNFVAFNEILYTYEERDTIEQIDKRIQDLKRQLKVINNVKYITKKDGKPFKDIFKNLDPTPAKNMRLTYWADSFGYYTLSLSERHTKQTTDEATIEYNEYYRLDVYKIESLEQLKNDLQRMKEQKENHIKEYEHDKQNIKKIFKKARELKNTLNNYTYTTKEAIKKFL